MIGRASIFLAGLAGALGIAAVVPLQAAEYKNIMTGQPTADDLIEALSRTEAPLTRGIRPQGEVDARPAEVNLPVVTFEFDSADLTPGARDVLDELAAALNSQELGSSRFAIEGHTDTLGSGEYNLMLSERRAAAVSEYLASQQVDPSRLQTVGKGEAEPIDPDGAAAVNRRVKVVNLGGS